jgi:hypothetical protein
VVAALSVSVPVGSYALRSSFDSPPISAEVFQDGDRRYLAAIVPSVPKRQAVSYSLTTPPLPPTTAPRALITFVHKGRNILVRRDDKLWTELHIDDARNKPFFFPLVGPTGDSYTRAYPMMMVPGEDRDHPHQKSWWFTHGNVDGVDFWSEGDKFGTIRQTAVREVVSGPVLGRLRSRNEWIAPGGGKLCGDERTITFYRTSRTRVIDFEIAITATDGPATFRDTKEGMFGLRVASTMDVDKKAGGKITNAEGLTDEKAWGQASAWVDYVGPVNGKLVGIAVLNHPQSFRFPTTWHVRTYGLFAANPFGWHDFGKPAQGDHTIPRGQKIAFGYRVILHEGDTESASLPRLFTAFAQPPALDVEVAP